MKLIESQIHTLPDEYYNVWLADDESQITPSFDPKSCSGSMIITITGKVFIKNTDGKWQKYGSAEVVE